MSSKLKQKLHNILSSEHRDELVWGLIQDLEMYILSDKLIEEELKSDKPDSEKLKKIAEVVIF